MNYTKFTNSFFEAAEGAKSAERDFRVLELHEFWMFRLPGRQGESEKQRLEY